MDWAEALAHMPQRIVVADRKGRVLLLSGDVPGVRVGRSFLKMAAPDEVVMLGRAAKAALREAEPAVVDELEARDGNLYAVTMIPFARGTRGIDHLVVLVEEATAEPEFSLSDDFEPAEPPTSKLPFSKPVEVDEPTQNDDEDTPDPAPPRQEVPLAPANELVIVAAGGTVPLARALAKTLGDRVKARAWPVAKLVETLRERGGDALPAHIDGVVDPGTRLLFLGDSPFSDEVRDTADQLQNGSRSGWAFGGAQVRRAAVWSPSLDGSMSEHLGDLQFEVMEICRLAMPIGRNKRVAPALKLAADFLEDPACAEIEGKVRDQVRHQQLVLGIALFLQHGLEPLLSTDRPQA